jgi:hypothetical protein
MTGSKSCFAGQKPEKDFLKTNTDTKADTNADTKADTNAGIKFDANVAASGMLTPFTTVYQKLTNPAVMGKTFAEITKTGLPPNEFTNTLTRSQIEATHSKPQEDFEITAATISPVEKNAQEPKWATMAAASPPQSNPESIPTHCKVKEPKKSKASASLKSSNSSESLNSSELSTPVEKPAL